MKKVNVELTKKELTELAKILEKFELKEYKDTGMCMINGGFAKAYMFDYDEDTIDIELQWGEQDMGSGSSVKHTEQFTFPRSVLLTETQIEDKVLAIRANN